MPALTPALLAEIKAHYLPDDAVTNGWTDEVIETRWTGGIPSTVRLYWLDRVTDTAGYLDIPDPGGTLPITQIHRQAKEMLAYWDEYLAKHGDIIVLTGARPTRVGKIKRRYERAGTVMLPPNYSAHTPYNRTD